MIFTLLTVLFIGLKLTGYIDWSWFYVLLPSIILVILYVVVIAVHAYYKTKEELLKS